MEIILTESFQKDFSHLEPHTKSHVIEVLLKLPKAIQSPQTHSGIGLRKLHASGIFEARVGLGLRIVFGYRAHQLIFHRLGSHDEIHRYLKKF